MQLETSIGKQAPDSTGSPVSVARVQAERSYVGVGELLQRWIEEADEGAWSQITEKIDYTYRHLERILDLLDRGARADPRAGARAAGDGEKKMTDDVVLEVENLWKDYGSFHALSEVSFSVRRGEIYGLLGRNGSGKTTLLRILTGYRFPTAGAVRIDGMDLMARPLPIRRRIGYMPEHPQLYADLTVRGFLRFLAGVHGLSRAEAARRIRDLSGRFSLEAVIDRLAGHCSKGYRARVALAGAVLHEPTLVFLDEPTDGLDPEQRSHTHGLIRDLAEGSTVVLSSHDLDEVARLCSRALVLDRGRVAREGTIEELGGVSGIAEILATTQERQRGEKT